MLLVLSVGLSIWLLQSQQRSNFQQQQASEQLQALQQQNKAVQEKLDKLLQQGVNAYAETEYRSVLKLREKVLGLEHPDTLGTCFDLAVCLRVENKIQEANAFAQRAADGANKVLGPEHPDTKKYDQLKEELLAKGG